MNLHILFTKMQICLKSGRKYFEFNQITRRKSGNSQRNREAVEEVIGSAVQMINKRLPEYKISVLIPDDLLFVSMDAKLIERIDQFIG